MTRNAANRNRLEWIMLVMVLMTVGALLGYSQYSERREIEDREGDRLQVQARVIGENLERQLEGVNNALAGIRDDLLQFGAKGMSVSPSRRLKTLSGAMTGVRTLIVTNADGMALDSNRDVLIGQNFSEREWYKTPRERPNLAMLYVSAPFETVLGVVAVNVTRAVVDPRGEFAGVVSASLDPEYFNVLLRSVLYAPDMRVAVVHGEGKAFIFMPPREGMVGMNLANPGSFFVRHRDSGQIATLLSGTAAVSSDARLMASRTINRAGVPMDKPLVVHVSRNLAAMYLPWREQSIAYGTLFGLLALIAGIVLYPVQRRRQMADRLAAAREAERHESAERLELALAGADLGLWDWHVPSGKMQLNERWFSMLGYRRNEVEPDISSWEKLVHPEDAPFVHAALDKHFRNEAPGYETEHRLRHKDGHWVWILDRGRVVERDAAGVPVRVVGTYMDVTERRRVDDERKQFLRFFELSLDPMCIADPFGCFKQVNPAFLKLTGYGESELLARPFMEFIVPEDREKTAEEMKLQVAARPSMYFENRYVCKDGRSVNLTWMAYFDKSDGVTYAIARDITEQKRKEAEYDTVIQASTDGFWITDFSGRILHVNQTICRMLGYSADELLRMSIADIEVGETPEEVAAHMQRLVSSGSALFQGKHRRKDGSVIDVEVSVLSVAALGERFFAFVRDITKRKLAEVARAQLEAHVRESQKMEALGTLAGGVAHDFNNIIAAIMGNVELARQDVGPGHLALESLEEISKASLRAKDLVQQILAFGRRQPASRKVISLAPVVEESARLLRTILPAGVELKVECESEAPAVLADATQVEQVLLNLCNNAWHAIQTQARTGRIDVRLRAHERGAVPAQSAQIAFASGEMQPGRYACLEVQDNGSGMDRETVARIFEPFFTTKPVDKGTGLGLAVVHGIVQDHGACIEVQSVPGEGSTFCVYFPATQESGQAVQVRAPGAVPAHGEGKHVLFVDDDESIVFLMTRLLERQGYRVSGFTDAREALAAARANPEQFDLAVTDFNMPGMSGLDVARELREIRPGLPVAVASGYITDELRAQAPAVGVRELVYKPNTVDELCEVVSRLARELRD